MEKAIKKFHNLQNVAKAYSNQFKICMFLRERSFQAVWNFASQPEFPQKEKEQMGGLYNQFEAEKQSSGWNSQNNIEKQYYSQFLEYFYKQNSMEKADVEVLTVCLHLTEELSFWGPTDNLTNERINYFHKKINKFLQGQQQQQAQTFGLESQDLLGYNKKNDFGASQGSNNMQQNNSYQAGNFNMNSQQNSYGNMNNQGMNNNYNNNNNNYNNNNYNNNNYNNNNYNNNNYNNNNYSSSSNSNYLDNFGHQGLPVKVDPRFARKISKREPAYKELREIIERHIEYANLELDYHNVNEARERLKAAAYYLSNVIE